MENLLRIKVEKCQEYATITILEQAEYLRGYNNDYEASNGITIASVEYPDAVGDCVFIRGIDRNKDNRGIIVNLSKLDLVIEAFKEWAEWMKTPESDTWRTTEVHPAMEITNTEVYEF